MQNKPGLEMKTPVENENATKDEWILAMEDLDKELDEILQRIDTIPERIPEVSKSIE